MIIKPLILLQYSLIEFTFCNNSKEIHWVVVHFLFSDIGSQPPHQMAKAGGMYGSSNPKELLYSCVSLLQSPKLWSIHTVVNIHWEYEECVTNCLNILVYSVSGRGQ